MITIKLKLTNEINITDLQRQYNNVVRFSYNRFKDNVDKTSIIRLCKSKLNNIPDMDASWIGDAVSKANSLYLAQPDETVVFGGKWIFNQRSKGKITAEDFSLKRLIPITFIGSSCDTCGNRKFKLDVIKNNKIIFKPKFGNHIDLYFNKPSKNQYKMLCALEEKARKHEEPATFSLTNEYVYVTFDECVIKKEYTNFKPGRVLSLDMNPNYIGVSICDYTKDREQVIIHKEIISNKEINDIDVKGLPSTHPKSKYKNNKRTFETYEINKYLVKLAKSYHCEYLTFEKLSMEGKEHKKGKNYNRLVNNMWNRTKMHHNLVKVCNIEGIKTQEVLSQYSSFIGQVLHPSEIDSVAASLEINRRSNLFIGMYRTKSIPLGHNVVFPKLDKSLVLNRWKEEGLSDQNLSCWKDVYDWVKTRELSWRVLFSPEKVDSSFRLKSRKSLVKRYFSI